MTNFALFSTIASLIIFVGFVTASVICFGWRKSYSSYASQWNWLAPLGNDTYLWSIVTVIIAALLCFAVLEKGEGSALQFLGFFAPAYLVVAAMTPHYETRKKQRIIHTIGAILCALCSVAWILFVRQLWYPVPFALLAAWIAATVTNTLKTSTFLWGELAMFAAVYVSLFVG